MHPTFPGIANGVLFWPSQATLPGLCSVSSDDPLSPPSGGGADHFVPGTALRTPLLGLSPESYQNAQAAYREGLARHGIAALLECSTRHGSTPDNDPVWLTFSPFGWHCREFMALVHNPEVSGYLGKQDFLKIACYGAGLHSETDYVRYRYPGLGLGPFEPSVKRRLETLSDNLFGSGGKCSYEPRELLLLFLREDRQGTIEVFDNQPELGRELTRPTLPMADLFDFYYPEDEPVSDIVENYRYLSRERRVDQGETPLPPLGRVHHLNVALTSGEMAKIRHRPLDIAVDPLNEGAEKDDARFHLSVWLEGQFFFEEPLRWIALSRIVRAMSPESYLLTNPIRQTRGKVVAYDHLRAFASLFGLEFMGLAPNHMQKQGAAALYRRVSDRETPVVAQLAGI